MRKYVYLQEQLAHPHEVWPEPYPVPYVDARGVTPATEAAAAVATKHSRSRAETFMSALGLQQAEVRFRCAHAATRSLFLRGEGLALE